MNNPKRAPKDRHAAPMGRPEPRNERERAQRIIDDLEGMREDQEWNASLQARFTGAGNRAVKEMWESGLNERGRPLSKFEWQALGERWCTLFGFLPPRGGVADRPESEPQPQDDTMLAINEVARMTGLSISSINRMYRETPARFPLPTQQSARRKGWPAHIVKDWISERAWRR